MAYTPFAPKSVPDPSQKDLQREFIPGRNASAYLGVLTAEKLGLQTPVNLSWSDIETIRVDATVDSSVELLKELILAEHIQIVAKAFTEDDPRAVISHEIADFVSWALPANLTSTLNSLLEAIYYGYAVGELVYSNVSVGDFAGKLRLDSIKIKDRNAIELVVDDFWNVVGVRSKVAGKDGKGTNRVYPRQKFVLLTLNKRGEDPRGNSSLRSIYGAWRFKQEIWPTYVRFMRTCAIPSLVGVLPENPRPQPRLNSDGTPVTTMSGDPVYDQPGQALMTALEGMENAMSLVVAFGTQITPIEASDNYQLFADAVDVANREIVLGLLRQTRATTEAQNGSKADSETGRSMLSYFVTHMRRLLSECLLEDVVKPLVLYNFGVEALDMLPSIDMGETDRYDWGTDARAAAMLASSLTDSQWDAATTMLGLPLPLPGEQRPSRRSVLTNSSGDAGGKNQQDQGADNTGDQQDKGDTENA